MTKIEDKIHEFEGTKFKLVLSKCSSSNSSGTFGHSNSYSITNLVKINNESEEIIGQFSELIHNMGSWGSETTIEYSGRTLITDKKINVKFEKKKDYLSIYEVLWGSVAR